MFFFPLPLFSSLTHAWWHTQNTEAVLTRDADGDSLLKRKSSQYDWSLLWEALFSSSILQGIFVSQHCEIFFFSLCLCAWQRKSFPPSVVFVSVTVLITNCLIFFFQVDKKLRYSTIQFSLAVGLWHGFWIKQRWVSFATGAGGFFLLFCYDLIFLPFIPRNN